MRNVFFYLTILTGVVLVMIPAGHGAAKPIAALCFLCSIIWTVLHLVHLKRTMEQALHEHQE